MDIETVKNLANLSKISITDEEAQNVAKDLAQVLSYVDQIKNAPIGDIDTDKPLLNNNFREDTNPLQTGFYTEVLLAEAPNKQDNYFKVPKIL